MNSFLKRVRLAVRLPQRQAVFQLNKERIGVPFLYVGLLSALVCIPLSIETFLQSEGIIADLALPMFLVYFVFVYFPLFALSVYSLIAVVTALARAIALAAKRKLTFLMLYKIACFAATLPILGYGACLLVNEALAKIWVGISIVFILVLLIRLLFHYPQANKSKLHKQMK
ncbi:hypothetical protein [Shouchella clausii]|uniref:hypothetical protein n=1 Tax=Shouchella clausii TaxID=79880 RepID=UPI00280BE285|nr:hypothetical protein [Shouchella clausii]WMM33940.1 hypothetical protein Q7C08_07645 [Shouchella clausii]